MKFPRPLSSRSVESDVAGALGSIIDGLRAGMSLRTAVLRTAGTDGSPLATIAPVLAGLDAGRPLGDVLRLAAAPAKDADLRAALCVLAAHAEAGGDPVPAVSALASRLRRRQAARREARALTTQARLGARAMLLLTPGFWLLLLASDARGTVASLTKSGPRTAVIGGVLFQLVGARWIGAIVRGAAETHRGDRAWSDAPVLRALAVLVRGRERSFVGDDIAESAETIGFVLDAGRSPSGALETVAPLVRGTFGEALTRAVARVRAGARVGDALCEATAGFGDAAARFARAFETSMTLGVPLAPAMRALADELRERSAVQLNEDVRRASVRVLVPVGLLILPAFVLSCLVPLFAGGLVGLSGS